MRVQANHTVYTPITDHYENQLDCLERMFLCWYSQNHSQPPNWIFLTKHLVVTSKCDWTEIKFPSGLHMLFSFHMHYKYQMFGTRSYFKFNGKYLVHHESHDQTGMRIFLFNQAFLVFLVAKCIVFFSPCFPPFSCFIMEFHSHACNQMLGRKKLFGGWLLFGLMCLLVLILCCFDLG